MRHTSWLNSLLSLNHLPPSLHAKEHIKWPSYLFLFLENCLSLASLLSFFDIFVQMENKTLQSLLTLRKQGYQPLRIVHTLHPSFTSSFHKTRWNLYSWCFYFFPPDYPLTSSHPSPSAQPHILKSLRAILGAECTVCFLMPAMNYFSFFFSLSITVHLAGCLFIHSAYSAKACSLERFQLSNSKKWF